MSEYQNRFNVKNWNREKSINKLKKKIMYYLTTIGVETENEKSGNTKMQKIKYVKVLKK
jgi:hypothetical protein